MPFFASATVSPDNHTKCASVARPWLMKNRRTNAFVEQRVRVLLAFQRSAAHDAFQLRPHHDLRDPLAVTHDARTLERHRQLGARALKSARCSGVLARC